MNIKLKKITLYAMKVLTLLLCLFGFVQSAFAEELTPCDDRKIQFKAYFQGEGRPDLEWNTFVNSRSPFEKFVVELVNHVKAKLSNEVACEQKSLENPEISLTFVERHFPVYQGEWGLYKKEQELTLKIDPSSLNNFSCQLSSPWLDMTIQRNPNLVVTAVFNFEDRQFLVDQTLLTYPNLAATFERQPLTDNIYERYEKEYLALHSTRKSYRTKMPSPETAKNIPLDMLWLFDHTRSESAGIYEINRLVRARHQGYAKLVKAIVSHCFASDQYELQSFKTIYELESFYKAKALNNYRIKSHKKIN
ncbi:hypothetical protein [Colwellia sp. TT2012]|uniref:hypothetical protein n=1 Tax=Colwellia sp. TT2012 TaxID=1720342 RepID=UPI00070B1F29|nr:hypothetical protein [Colwellia sp. TT2012]